MTRPGLEPGISGSGGRHLIHYPNGPHNTDPQMRRHDVPQRCFSPVQQGGTPGADSNRTRAPASSARPRTRLANANATACNAETRDRTGDLQIFGLTLSQLSYRGRCAEKGHRRRARHNRPAVGLQTTAPALAPAAPTSGLELSLASPRAQCGTHCFENNLRLKGAAPPQLVAKAFPHPRRQASPKASRRTRAARPNCDTPAYRTLRKRAGAATRRASDYRPPPLNKNTLRRSEVRSMFLFRVGKATTVMSCFIPFLLGPSPSCLFHSFSRFLPNKTFWPNRGVMFLF